MRITERQAIGQTLHAYMLKPREQVAPFLVEIRVAPGAQWNGRQVPRGGLSIEGARPIGSATAPDGECDYTLSNSDSGYSTSIGQVRLSEIESVRALD